MRSFFLLALLSLFVGCSHQPAAPEISGPFKHENLSVYFIHGTDQRPGVKYLSLGEAIDQKKLVVHETGSVNELAVENVGDEDVYIQAGEIVKGGQQDRTMATDMIVAAHSGKMPIASFCVEHGRWTQRGGEAAGYFGASKDMVAGQQMKLASNSNYAGNNQNEVWASVADAQRKLSATVGAPVASSQSASSFQLTMESEKLDEKLNAYIKQINYEADARGRQNGPVVGWCYAVNGKIIGANVYASPALFEKLWPKLLKSGAVEALAEHNVDPMKFSSPKLEEVQWYLESAGNAAATKNDVNARTSVTTKEESGKVMLQTEDGKQWIHRCYMTKDSNAVIQSETNRINAPQQSFELNNTQNQRQR